MASRKSMSNARKKTKQKQQSRKGMIKKVKMSCLIKQQRNRTNARERKRMGRLNAALDKLRRCLPLCDNNSDHVFHNHQKSEKLSKIETLKLAKNYINTLSEILKKDRLLEAEEYEKLLVPGLRDSTTAMLVTICKCDVSI